MSISTNVQSQLRTKQDQNRYDLTWRVEYHDGLNLWEWEDKGILNPYSSIDRKKLHTNGGKFYLYHPNNRLVPVFVLELTPNQRLIWRKRRFLKMAEGGMPGEKLRTVYLVGWHQTIHEKNSEPRNIKSILYIHQSGQVIMSGVKDDIAIKPYECE